MILWADAAVDGEERLLLEPWNEDCLEDFVALAAEPIAECPLLHMANSERPVQPGESAPDLGVQKPSYRPD